MPVVRNRAGETVCLVGRSEIRAKTTFVKLVQRLYDVSGRQPS